MDRFELVGLLPFALAALLALRGVQLLRNPGLPWTRALLPLLAAAELAGARLQAGRGWLWVRLLTIGLLEVFLIVRLIQALRAPGNEAPEGTIALRLEAFLPPRAARLVALEAVCLSGAVSFLFGGWRRPLPAGHSLYRTAHLTALLPVMPLLLPADLALVALLLKGAPFWAKALFHAVSLYSLFWVLGMWVAFRNRPHGVLGDRALFRRGFLSRVEVPLTAIQGWARLQDDPELLADLRRKGAIRSYLPGNTVFRIDLTQPQRVQGFTGPGKPVSTLLVGVDDADTFEAALGKAGIRA